MKKYTLTLYASIEAENEKEALKEFNKWKVSYWNTGENIEIEPEPKL